MRDCRIDEKELVIADLRGSEGGVGHAAFLAQRQGGGDGIDAFGEGKSVLEQSSEDGGGEGGHDVGLTPLPMPSESTKTGCWPLSKAA